MLNITYDFTEEADKHLTVESCYIHDITHTQQEIQLNSEVSRRVPQMEVEIQMNRYFVINLKRLLL